MVEQHPEVTKAIEQVRQILDAIDAEIGPRVRKLQEMMERASEAARREMGMELSQILADAQRNREMAMRPVLDLAANYPPKQIIIMDLHK